MTADNNVPGQIKAGGGGLALDQLAVDGLGALGAGARQANRPSIEAAFAQGRCPWLDRVDLVTR
jgi:hypothetical protein